MSPTFGVYLCSTMVVASIYSHAGAWTAGTCVFMNNGKIVKDDFFSEKLIFLFSAISNQTHAITQYFSEIQKFAFVRGTFPKGVETLK